MLVPQLKMNLEKYHFSTVSLKLKLHVMYGHSTQSAFMSHAAVYINHVVTGPAAITHQPRAVCIHAEHHTTRYVQQLHLLKELTSQF